MPNPEPGTSEWWIKRLSDELNSRHDEMTLNENYYDGNHNLLFATPKFRSAFGQMFSAFSDNFCEVVVDATEERLSVDGFRFGGDENPQADKEAWRIWQANGLDAESQVCHTESLVKSRAYTLIWNNPADPETPLITVEDPLQMVVAHDPANKRLRKAAFKRWLDDTGFMFGYLYLPDRIEKYRSRKPIEKAVSKAELEAIVWDPWEEEDEAWPLKNPLGEVPVVAFTNRKRLTGAGKSEIQTVRPIQDAINKMCADMLVSSEFAAFIQRWITGVEVPIDPETGRPIETFKAHVDRIFATESENAKFGEFSQHDPKVFIGPIEMFIQHLATQTRTPPHYFLASMGNFPSGESLKSAETGLVSKVKRKARHFGESWEETLRLSFKVLGDARGSVSDAETLWQNPEFRTMGELVDALVKLKQIGVPDRALWEEYGATPQQMARWEELKDQEPEEEPVPT